MDGSVACVWWRGGCVVDCPGACRACTEGISGGSVISRGGGDACLSGPFICVESQLCDDRAKF